MTQALTTKTCPTQESNSRHEETPGQMALAAFQRKEDSGLPSGQLSSCLAVRVSMALFPL